MHGGNLCQELPVPKDGFRLPWRKVEQSVFQHRLTKMLVHIASMAEWSCLKAGSPFANILHGCSIFIHDSHVKAHTTEIGESKVGYMVHL